MLYDRGVKFGLDGGRVESIMVSGNAVHTEVSLTSNSYLQVQVLSSSFQVRPRDDPGSVKEESYHLCPTSVDHT